MLRAGFLICVLSVLSGCAPSIAPKPDASAQGASVQGASVQEASAHLKKSFGVAPQTFWADQRALFGTVKLKVLVYKPSGAGPFPLVVINHGKSPGDPADQRDNSYYRQSQQFVSRGYVVLVPTREGFGSSGGIYQSAVCDQAVTGEDQAKSIEAAIVFAKTLPYVNGQKIVVIGQSEGGLATMALGERHIPGVIGLINVVGGIEYPQCANWPQGDVDAFSKYGAHDNTPALFMYGDNDNHWGSGGIMPRRFYQAYVKAGGHAQFIDFGTFGDNSHFMFGSRKGQHIWLPAFKSFFNSIGLPFTKQPPHVTYAMSETGGS